MKTSVIYLVIFTICATLGVVKDWHSWFFGFAFGISIAQIVEYCKGRWLGEPRRGGKPLGWRKPY